jgi:hypothetical protein
LALPNNADSPIVTTQSSDIPKVTAAVLSQLRKPEAQFRFRKPCESATRMPMPKTTVNEDDLPAFREDKVGFSWQVGYVEPESVSTRTCNFPHQQFRFRILAADERHPLAALSPGKRVHRHVQVVLTSPDGIPCLSHCATQRLLTLWKNLHWYSNECKQNCSLFHRPIKGGCQPRIRVSSITRSLVADARFTKSTVYRLERTNAPESKAVTICQMPALYV